MNKKKKPTRKTKTQPKNKKPRKEVNRVNSDFQFHTVDSRIERREIATQEQTTYRQRDISDCIKRINSGGKCSALNTRDNYGNVVGGNNPSYYGDKPQDELRKG